VAQQPFAVEFYRKGGGLIVAVDGAMSVPRAGEYVNIERKTWQVEIVTWAVDQPGDGVKPRLRANVEMTEMKIKPV
jgi:hypothetical protein